MSGVDKPAFSVDVATTAPMTEVRSPPTSRTVVPPKSTGVNEIEIPLELVCGSACDERMPGKTAADDARPRRRTRLTGSPAGSTEGLLSPLYEEELTTSSSSSSSSSSSPDDDDVNNSNNDNNDNIDNVVDNDDDSDNDNDNRENNIDDDDDDWVPCCTDNPSADSAVPDCKLSATTASDSLCSIDTRQQPLDSSTADVMSGSTAGVPLSMIGGNNRTSHHPSYSAGSGLTARLGNLLNSAVMKAQKQLGRGRTFCRFLLRGIFFTYFALQESTCS